MQTPSTQGVGGGVAVHKLAPVFPTVPASRGARIEPGPMCQLAREFGIVIELGGESESAERLGWEGYFFRGPRIGESMTVYESAEDCAVAGLTALRDAIDTLL